ncbi:MAG: response regulator transcription factor [Actinomycetota bacterium]
MTRVIRVLIVARSDIVLSGLRSLVSSDHDLQVAGAVTTSREVRESVSRMAPDVIVVEDPAVECPDSASATVRRLARGIPIVVVLTGRGVRDKTRLFGQGIAGLLHLTADADEIRRAIRLVADGVPVLDRRFTRPFVLEVLRRTAAHRRALSCRETQVIGLVAEGLTDAKIADRLGLSTSTVKTYVRRSLTKLESPSRAAAATRVAMWGDEMGPGE